MVGGGSKVKKLRKVINTRDINVSYVLVEEMTSVRLLMMLKCVMRLPLTLDQVILSKIAL